MKLVILDRDGTINADRDDYVKTPEEWVALPGAMEAIARLNHAGWHTVIATNQSGLGRGLFDMTTLNAMHAKLNKELAVAGGRIDAVFFCPHAPSEHCACRKPLPGLFMQIGERFGVELSDVIAVGDSLRDLQAAAAAGCQTHLVRTGKSDPARLDAAGAAQLAASVPGTVVHADLASFAEFVVQRERRARALARGEAESRSDSGPGELR
jgi:D-glycero-D-manno-heptose 1,7-bisphosphate phosphatase